MRHAPVIHPLSSDGLAGLDYGLPRTPTNTAPPHIGCFSADAPNPQPKPRKPESYNQTPDVIYIEAFAEVDSPCRLNSESLVCWGNCFSQQG